MRSLTLLAMLAFAGPALADANTDIDTDTDTDPTHTGDTQTDDGAKSDDGRCGCSSGQTTSAVSFGLGLVLLGAARRRR